MPDPKDTPDAAPERSESASSTEKKKGTGRGPKVAIGIGSAAIVAALLYANRSRRNDRGD